MSITAECVYSAVIEFKDHVCNQKFYPVYINSLIFTVLDKFHYYKIKYKNNEWEKFESSQFWI